MTPKTNLHTHTSFTDGADTAETMVRAALERGFFSLGFSDHMPDGWWRIPPETVAEYRAEALRLKEKYFGQIEIAVGAERDFSVPLPHDGWDYLIDSVHVFRVGGESFPVDHSREDLLLTLTERFGGDGLRMAADYYGMVCRCIEERDVSSRWAYVPMSMCSLFRQKWRKAIWLRKPVYPVVGMAERIARMSSRRSRGCVCSFRKS